MQLCPECNQNNRDSARFCANCQAQLLGLLGANTLLQGRYEVMRVLGCGGMGAVYLAKDVRLAGKKVALKENFDTSSKAQNQFRREASILAHLSHSNLPAVTDHFIEPNGRQYLVMTWIEGQSLTERLDQGKPLAEADVLAWADQLLDALAYCHQESVIHRDIKPQNIILTPQGRAVLVDFGLVKLYDPANPATSTSMHGMGTPEYAPPEQYGIVTEHTEARSDIYSLGATLYHLLTGQAPPTAGQRIANPAVLHQPRQYNPGLSVQTETAILQAMALPLVDRFQSAAEMRRALSLSTPKRKSWFGAIASGIAVLLLVALAIWGVNVNDLFDDNSPSLLSTQPLPSFTSTSDSDNRTESINRSATMKPSPTPVFELSPTPTELSELSLPTLEPTEEVSEIITPSPTSTAPNGLVAYSTGSNNNWQIFISDPTTGNTWPLPGLPSNSGVPAWSPDGRRLAFRSNNSGTWEIYTINVDGSDLRQITNDSSDNLEAAWSPDGTQIAFVSNRDGNQEIYLMNNDGTAQRRLTSNPGWDDDPSWSPDGKRLVFESKRDGRIDIYRMAVDGSNIVRLTDAADLNSTPAWSPNGSLIAFERKSGSTYHIWIMNADGSNHRQLTTDGEQNLRPAWSPTGGEIAYTSDRGGAEAIWIIALDRDSVPRRLSPETGFDAAWSRR